MDTIETIKGSVVQHGRHNDRVYVMHFGSADTVGLVARLEALAVEHGYGKVLAKIPAPAWPLFQSAAYCREAVVPGFFRGSTDGLFIAKYFSVARRSAPAPKVLLEPSAHAKLSPPVRPGYRVIPCRTADAQEMASFYRRIFKTYPFPIQEPAYLARMMAAGARYFCIRLQGRIAAIAAAEINLEHENAEMTDFATRPQWRGMGLAGLLLLRLEQSARELDMKTAYTIARAASQPMNALFCNRGYAYAGLLKKNSQIGGRIASMIVWHKSLGCAV
jgi:putative beta-lysine N-acetyltransferase